jgi:hypothetical protein
VDSKPVVVKTFYRLELAEYEMRSILKKDAELWNQPYPNLFGCLKEFNLISDVDYSGHYGAGVFYSVLSEDDVLSTHARVRSIVRPFLRS